MLYIDLAFVKECNEKKLLGAALRRRVCLKTYTRQVCIKRRNEMEFLLLQNGQLCSRIMTVFWPFFISEHFPAKMGVLLLPEVEKPQP